jgi:hypothetical protein
MTALHRPRHRLLQAAAWLLALTCLAAVEAADEFPTEPLLRLDPEGHFASIRRIDVDARGRWLVSGAHDKTVKVWRLADGTLERTLRLPQGEGNLGKVYAVAISPDGEQVAAGGWTGSADGLNTTIYILDRASGALVHRIAGLPHRINHLAYDARGERLAVTLSRSDGLRLFRTDDYEEISRDPNYGGRSYWADFATDVVARLRRQAGPTGLYKDVHARLLRDGGATRQAILEGLEWLEREADAPDVAVVFLAGHGITNPRGEYYFLPYDGKPLSIKTTAVKGHDFRDFLSAVAGKAVLFLDTCHAGAFETDLSGRTRELAETDVTRFANELAGAESGVIVFASSTGEQKSYELDEQGHGAFTHALLEGLEGPADYTKDFFLYISELETYLTERVSELTDKRQKPVTTKPRVTENYRLLRVADEKGDSE